MKRRRKLRWAIIVLGLLLIGSLAFVFFFVRSLSAVGGGARGYIRVDYATDRMALLQDAETKGYIRSARALDLLARLTGRPAKVGVGTYLQFSAESGYRNLRNLYHPIVQRLRMPETNFSKRDARLLAKYDVCSVDDYLKEVAHPEWYKPTFPLPGGSLEGYLYPDTYDFPPLLGAKGVVGRRLRAFGEKVWEPLGHPKDLQRILTIASLVELESGTDADRPMIAGVIENRLKRHMRLQIDASLLYGMGKWRRLTFKDYREFDSPYNLYRVEGLPPTPICSPSVKSIEAAMHPASHNDVYYVALPNGTSLFAATYEEHKKNIEKRKAALRAIGK